MTSELADRIPAHHTLLARAGSWRILDDHQFGTAAENVARDGLLGEAVARGDSPSLWRVWENAQSLVVSRQESNLASFEQAAQSMAAAAWPVVVRETGGSAVPHGPGILQLSMIMPRSVVMGFSTDAVYQLLSDPLQQTLSSFGISSQFGSVPDAYCDGRFNLVVAKKKIAGTAQAWRANVATNKGLKAGTKEGYVLAHATLFVCMDAEITTAAVNRFYTLAGVANRFEPKALTTADSCLRQSDSGSYGNSSRQLLKEVRSRLITTLQNYL